MTNPLIIAAVETRPGWGRLLISCCPGRTDLEHILSEDIDALRRAGASAVLTLTETEELEELEVAGLGQAVREAGMDWHHLPIIDYGAPEANFEIGWMEVGPALRARIRDGRDVHMHCRAGCGRSGMIAARLLVELDVCGADEAIRRVRFSRPCAIEREEQEDAVRAAKPLGDALRPIGG